MLKKLILLSALLAANVVMAQETIGPGKGLGLPNKNYKQIYQEKDKPFQLDFQGERSVFSEHINKFELKAAFEEKREIFTSCFSKNSKSFIDKEGSLLIQFYLDNKMKVLHPDILAQQSSVKSKPLYTCIENAVKNLKIKTELLSPDIKIIYEISFKTMPTS